MSCQKIRTPDGYMIICGGRRRLSKEEKALTEAQIKFLEISRIAAARCHVQAAEADRIGLGVMAREWDFVGKTLDAAIANQIRLFRDQGNPAAERTADTAPAPQQMKLADAE